MIKGFLNDLIKKKLKDTVLEHTGLDPEILESVDTDAIGSILTGLTKNAKEGGAVGIFEALNNHQGESIRKPDEYGTNLESKKPEGILNHVFGEQLEKIVGAIAEKNGIDSKQAMSAMKFMAPLVMSYFGKQKIKDPQQLTSRLEIEQKAIEKDTNISFTSLFDQDGDGDFDLGDVMKMIG